MSKKSVTCEEHLNSLPREAILLDIPTVTGTALVRLSQKKKKVIAKIGKGATALLHSSLFENTR